jgi:NADH-quinone oxidoreductase subunit C/D
MKPEPSPTAGELLARFGGTLIRQETRDDLLTFWAPEDGIKQLLGFLKEEIPKPFSMLYDLTAIDERARKRREGQPPSDFTVVYHLLSFERNEDIRIKTALRGEHPSVRTITDLWPSANWYEREVWDMFGVSFNGHPCLRRILMPPTWKGHPLRKEHPARATELGPFTLTEERERAEQEALRFVPEEWGMKREGDDAEFLFLNLGPAHTGTHGLLRFVLQLDGEEIVDAVPDIGYHHRGVEKMAERQTWHTFIPYTDRVEYLGGVMNNFPYVLAVEKLAGIEVPDRAKAIRVMLAELSRIASHLVWYGTYAQDLGAMSPVFYMFNDRERVFAIIEAVTGGRMHPSWFRIGGVAHDLPSGWDVMVREFIAHFAPRVREYDRTVMKNRILKSRSIGVGRYDLREAIEWGVTGPGLRACGFDWDLRKRRPYSGYEQFDFEVPTAQGGDCYDRGLVRIEEMRQSLRIIEQCLENMPSGPCKSDHPLATPPRKEMTMRDIETLITHFLGTTWGPVIPAGEAFFGIEATKGSNGYYLVSDGGIHAYRLRVRTPSFPHIQMVPFVSRGSLVSDLIAILGSVDYVLSDVDR